MDGEDLGDRACPRQLAASRARRRKIHEPWGFRRCGRRVSRHRTVDGAGRPAVVVELREHRRRAHSLPGGRAVARDPGEPRCNGTRPHRLRCRVARQLHRIAGGSVARPQSRRLSGHPQCAALSPDRRGIRLGGGRGRPHRYRTGQLDFDTGPFVGPSAGGRQADTRIAAWRTQDQADVHDLAADDVDAPGRLDAIRSS